MVRGRTSDLTPSAAINIGRVKEKGRRRKRSAGRHSADHRRGEVTKKGAERPTAIDGHSFTTQRD